MANESSDRDETIRHLLSVKIYRYWPMALTVLGLVLLGGGGTWAYRYFQHEKNIEVRGQLYAQEKAIQEAEKKLFDKALESVNKKSNKNQDKNQIPEVKKDQATFDANYAELAQKLDATIRAHADLEVARTSAMFLADFYSQYGQNDKAKDLLKSMLKSGSSSVVTVGLLKSQLAGMLTNKTECSEAVQLYTELINEASLKFLYPTSLLRRAACQFQLGKVQEGESDIDTLKAEHSSSEAAQMADSLLRVALARGIDSK